MTIITKRGVCPACMMTQKVLDAKGIKYNLRHLDNEKIKQQLRNKGIKQYPVVEPNDKLDKSAFWGFRPDKLN